MSALLSLIVGLFVVIPTVLATSGCCDQLRAATSGDKLQHVNLLPNASTPTSTSNVSVTVKILAANNCEFAVRGGGHTANPGWAGTSNDVLISLSHLKTTQFSEDNSSGDLYTETGKHDVTVAGGRISPVGVSGFLLGEGLSYLMHGKGFAADSIVLANGTIANPSSTSFPDLFKALKGGTGNFGIVTRFQLRAYPVNKVYAGNLYYAPAQYDALFPAIETYARDGTESAPKSHIISAWVNVPSKLLDMATFYAFYSQPVASPPPAIKPFFDIPTITNTLKVKTVHKHVFINDRSTSVDPWEPAYIVIYVQNDIRDYSIRADAALFKELFDLFGSNTAYLNTTAGWFSVIAFQPISNSMIRASEAKGGNVLGLEPGEDPLVGMYDMQLGWLLASDDALGRATVDELMLKSMDLARARGKLADFMRVVLDPVAKLASNIDPYPQIPELCKRGSGRNRSLWCRPSVVLAVCENQVRPAGVFRRLVKGVFKVPTP
ncbi:hypothetical protein FRC10_010445 [Ceratobasidium sp. 414]|nr:hypothetical protein FRC10_010445 [Ceratobasidium sp. 414]